MLVFFAGVAATVAVFSAIAVAIRVTVALEDIPANYK
jgi:hypothetical protein